MGDFLDKTLLITGGTGSFGQMFTDLTLKNCNPKNILIYSRDEMKHWFMSQKYQNNNKIRFMTGDIRDKERLNSAMKNIDYVVHAAATKIVPAAEYNPSECVKTNIIGAMNVIETSISNKVKKIVALSTDKASNPINFYGATKLASDKLFIASNNYEEKLNSKFAVVRYGNVMGSRGSIIPLFLKQNQEKKNFTITDKNMTRFMISLDEAVKLVWQTFGDMFGGEIYVKKIPSMKVIDIARAINNKSKFEIIGIRPGEKLHEQMIGYEDSDYTYEYKDYYKILPSINNWFLDKKRIKNGKKVSINFKYSSDLNKDWMTKEFLSKWILNNKSNFL